MFGAAGGVSVAAPLAALGVAGYAGAKMIQANLNDEQLDQVYGQKTGVDLLDRMTAEQMLLAKQYEALYGEGSEASMDAREALYKALEEGGIELPEQAVSLLENIFDERLREVDIDGRVEKFDLVADTLLGNTNSSGGKNGSSRDYYKISELKEAIMDAMGGMKVEMDGQTVGEVVTPYVSQGMGGLTAYLMKY